MSKAIVSSFQFDESGQVTGVILYGKTYYRITGTAIADDPLESRDSLQASTAIQYHALVRYHGIKSVGLGNSTSVSTTIQTGVLQRFHLENPLRWAKPQSKRAIWQEILRRFEMSVSQRDTYEYFLILQEFEAIWQEIRNALADPERYIETHRHPAITQR